MKKQYAQQEGQHKSHDPIKSIVSAMLYQAIEDYVILWKSKVVDNLNLIKWPERARRYDGKTESLVCGIRYNEACYLLQFIKGGGLHLLLEQSNLNVDADRIVNNLKNNPEAVFKNLVGMHVAKRNRVLNVKRRLENEQSVSCS